MKNMSGREPNFDNILKVLERKKPSRGTLFDLFLNNRIYSRLSGTTIEEFESMNFYQQMQCIVKTFHSAGYDFASVPGRDAFSLHPIRERLSTASINDGALITDWESFEKFDWPEPENFDDSALEKIQKDLPGNMKLMVLCPDGVLENVISLTGYDNLCFLVYEEPELVGRIFDEVGSRLVKYCDLAAAHDSVGIISSNDDWGFNTQTFLSPELMRKYVFPWHKKIVETVHARGKKCILHSCGYFGDVIDDVIDDMKFDGRHSYEDNIIPVEQAYDKYHDRIAILGGIDVGFIASSTPDEIYKRCIKMLERASDGGYALGTGNSVPDYLPDENYFAMLKAAWDFKC